MRLGLVILTICIGQAVIAAEPSDRVDYVKQIKPILTARCYSCHGALQQKGGFRADTVKSLTGERENEPAVVPGKGNESLLVERIGDAGADRMPPPSDGEPLAAGQIELIRKWIDQGAKAPADDRPEPDPREHWAFRSPVRVAVPKADDSNGRVVNPIDAFLVAEWKPKGIKPQSLASREQLQRRVTLDLTGLPPTTEERASFLEDQSADAYERLVDRLLAGRSYSERWARHWMDIWRYSDWWGLGAEVRNSQKHMWHWRDWIIESLTADKGYDAMIRDMLAADEIAPEDSGRVRATGFLARSYFKFNRNTWLEEVVEHTGKAFLGLTLNCAKCHDHKYDPVSQKDYYRFRAFFEPYYVRIDQVPGQLDYEKDGIPRVYDAHAEAPTYRFDRGNEAKPITNQPLAPGIPSLLAWENLKITPVPLPIGAAMPALRPFVLVDHRQAADAQVTASLAELVQAKSRLMTASQKDAELAKSKVNVAEKSVAASITERDSMLARAVADQARGNGKPAAELKALAIAAARAERTASALRAEATLAIAEIQAAEKPDDKALKKKRDDAAAALDVARKSLATTTDAYTSLRGALKSAESPLDTNPGAVATYPAVSTGRRTALALWLTDRRNPLTARVAVNHVWTRHFGAPLVATMFDFGRKGTAPTHPALLDWLAVDFMEHGWSLKRLHRTMVLSEAYRRGSSSAGADPKTLAADPENKLYWRMNPRRMEAQVVRDSLLRLAGVLEETQGGPSIPQTEESTPRRSIYFVHSHNDHGKFLSTFDDASVLDCYRRAESVVPAQALALWNSHLSMTMGTKIAKNLEARLGKASDADFASEAFRTILAVPPSTAEVSACEETLASLKILLVKRGVSNPDGKAREILVQSLINHNDFITIR